MIPTKEKERLPKGFSYPLGAEQISNAFGELPQADKISLRFGWRDEFWASQWRKRIKQRGTVTLVRIYYTPRWAEWWTYIYAVPADCSAAARDHLLSGTLAAIGDALRRTGPEPATFNEKILWALPPLKPAEQCR